MFATVLVVGNVIAMLTGQALQKNFSRLLGITCAQPLSFCQRWQCMPVAPVSEQTMDGCSGMHQMSGRHHCRNAHRSGLECMVLCTGIYKLPERSVRSCCINVRHDVSCGQCHRNAHRSGPAVIVLCTDFGILPAAPVYACSASMCTGDGWIQWHALN